LTILCEALAAHDFEQIRTLAHNLKGTGASYGFERLTELGAALETSAKQGDALEVQRQLERLQQYLGRVSVVSAAH